MQSAGDFAHLEKATGDVNVVISEYSAPEVQQPPKHSALAMIMFHLKTLFLFTKSDFKTVVLPQSIFAISAMLSAIMPTSSVESDSRLQTIATRIPLMLLWVWQNLLVENIANQRIPGGIVEDQTNKPWRPLPSKRLTVDEARQWLLVSITIAFGISVYLNSFTPSATLMTLIWAYNDLDGSSSGIWIRNALNAGGLMCFSWGALSVMAGGEDNLNRSAYTWILTTGAIIMTTVHTQDFPDIEGDIARGRHTVPILYGEGIARGSVITMVVLWSITCPMFWEASPAGWVAPVGIGATMSVLCALQWGQKWDEVAWKLWCFWAMSLYLLPVFGRN